MKNFISMMLGTALAVCSCRETELVLPDPDPPAPASRQLSLTPSRLFLKVGDRRMLTYQILPEGAAASTFSWKTGCRDIASINSAGMVTANSEGVTTIYLRESGGLEATCEVTVVAAFDSLVIPFTGTPATCTKERVIEYEISRGSVQDTVRSNENYLFFSTRSPVFPETVYVYDGRDFYVQAFSVPENSGVLESEDFKAMVTAAGFQPKPRSYLPGAENYSNGSYDLRIYPRARQVDIRYFPAQKVASPTWKDNPILDVYPLLGCSGIGLEGSPLKAVSLYEERSSGFADSTLAHADARTVVSFEKRNGDIHRWYLYHGTPGAEEFEGQAYHANLLWKDCSKAFRISGKDVWMTEEFDSMIQQSGWAYRGGAGGYYWYGKPALFRGVQTEMYFGIRAVRFSDFNDGEYSLQMQAYVDGPPD